LIECMDENKRWRFW